MHIKLLIRIVVYIVVVVFTSFLADVSFAKREQPKGIKPIVHNGYIYTLVTFKVRGKFGQVEFNCKLEASLDKKVVYEKLVYSYAIKADLEEDVQEIYPTKFSYEPSKMPPYGPKWFNVEREDGKAFKVLVNK
jgi:hypothetical protein